MAFGRVSAGTVTVDFDAETSKFTKGAKSVQDSLGGLSKSFTKLDSVAGLALRVFSATALIGFAKQAFNAADALGDAADRAGVAVESLSRLKFAADQNDVSFESLTSGLKKFQINLSNATSGSKEAAGKFSQVGISLAQIRDLSIEDQLAAVAESFKRLKNPADQTRIAAELFGKAAGPDMVPLLRQGKEGIAALTAEADRLGITMNGVAAQGIGEADKALKKLVATAQGFGTKFVGGLALAIFGPTDEILKTDDRIRTLEARRNEILRSGVGEKGTIGNLLTSAEEQKAFAAELATVNDELAKLQSLQKIQLGLITPRKSQGPQRRTGGFEFGSAVREIDIAEIQALKRKELDDLEVNRPFDQDILRAQASENLRNAQLQVAEDFADREKQIEATVTANLQEQIELRKQTQLSYRDAIFATETDIMRIREQATANGLAALQAFAGGSKKAAIALVLINKGFAIATAIQDGFVAVQKALASLPYPANLAAAAQIKVLTALNVAGIAATGFGQIQSINSSGGAPLGSAVNPVSVSRDAEEAGGATSQSAIQVIVTGNYGFDQRIIDQIVSGIREAADDRDVIIFGPNSRQAQELVSVG